jgi:hypothetical protein
VRISEIERGHRHLAVVGFRLIAGQAVQINGELAGRLGGVEPAGRATRAIIPLSTSPVPPVAMPGCRWD